MSVAEHGQWQRWWPWCRSGMLVGCASLRWISWLRCWCVCFKNPLPISNMLPSMIELPPCPTMVLLSQDVRLGRGNDDSHGCDGIHQVRTAIYVLNSPPVNLRSDRQCRFMTKNIRVHAVTFHFSLLLLISHNGASKLEMHLYHWPSQGTCCFQIGCYSHTTSYLIRIPTTITTIYPFFPSKLG